MKVGNLLFSAAQFLFAVVMIMGGALLLGVEHVPYLRFAVVQFFSQPETPLSIVGYGVMGCGILLMMLFYRIHRGVYYRLSMGQKETSVDPVVIETYVQEYWQKAFPGHDLSVEVRFPQGKNVEMFLEMPAIPEEEQFAALEKAEKALAEILKKQLRYKKEFTLSLLVK